jgi:hypothetical protein
MPKKQSPKATPFQFQFTVRGFVRVESATDPERPKLVGVLEMVDVEGRVIQLESTDGVPDLRAGFTTWPNLTPAEIAERAEAIQKRFEKDAPYFLLLEANNFLQDILWVTSPGDDDDSDDDDSDDDDSDDDDSDDDDSDTVDFHLDSTREFLNKHFGFNPPPLIKKRDTRRKWSKAELSRLIHTIERELPEEERTFDNVAAGVKLQDPERAPASGAALRQLCRRLNVDVPASLKKCGRRKKANK